MEIYVIGYGGWISNPLLGYPSLYIKTDINVLIDAGECTFAKMATCHLPWPDVVFISHKHGDHILGLPTFMLMARRLGKRIKIVANKETLEAARALALITGIENALQHVEFIEAENALRIGETSFAFAATAHPVPTLAIRVEHGGKCVTYSSDTSPSDKLIELARGCDLLIHEASGNPGQEEEAHKVGHSTTADAVNIALKAGVKMLMPIHFYLEPPVVPPGVTIVIPTPCGKIVV
ncbi:MBL fold metallo-hydrolase [Pyrobaculum aerophilum]|uniref:MBL fold metallo-hydrolase n=1 Tax=Pyrobaculum aerophilum TaxID=13773 RepID=UPI002FD89F8B